MSDRENIVALAFLGVLSIIAVAAEIRREQREKEMVRAQRDSRERLNDMTAEMNDVGRRMRAHFPLRSEVEASADGTPMGAEQPAAPKTYAGHFPDVLGQEGADE